MTIYQNLKHFDNWRFNLLNLVLRVKLKGIWLIKQPVSTLNTISEPVNIYQHVHFHPARDTQPYQKQSMTKCKKKQSRSWTSHILFKTWSPQPSNQQRTFEEERRGLTGSCTSDGAHRAPSALPLQSRTQNSVCGSGWRMGWNKSQLPLKPTHSPWPAASAQEVLKCQCQRGRAALPRSTVDEILAYLEGFVWGWRFSSSHAGGQVHWFVSGYLSQPWLSNKDVIETNRSVLPTFFSDAFNCIFFTHVLTEKWGTQNRDPNLR